MKQTSKHVTDNHYLWPFIFLTGLFFLWGFARSILDILNKHFQNHLNISIFESSLIQVTTYLGYFLTAIPAGLFAYRYGYRRALVLGLSLFGFGSLLFIPCSWIGTFTPFLMALFIIGCGLTFLEVSANPYVTGLGASESATSRLNLSQSFNGMGNIFATLIVGQFLFGQKSSNKDTALPYTILGCIVILLALIFSRINLPEIHQEEQTRNNGISHLKTLLRHKAFMFGLAALFCYEVAEISINSYFINYATAQGQMTDRQASFWLSVGLFLFMCGRFIGSRIMLSVSAFKVLRFCGFASLTCMILVLCDLGWLSLTALLACYVFEAVMFPTIFTLALQGLGPLTKGGASLLMMTPLGGTCFILMGWMADHIGPNIPFIIPSLGFIAVTAYTIKGKKY